MRVCAVALALIFTACSSARMGPGSSTGGGGTTSGSGGGSTGTGGGTTSGSGGGTTSGHEICGNGLDDDGDTFVDCADPDCFHDMSCFQTCADLCTAGAQICDGTGTRSCETDAQSGCKRFGSVTACSASLVCSGGACVSTCTNQCSAGMKQCSNTGGVVECKLLASGCTDWVGPTACQPDEVCSAGACVARGTCTNQCTQGATRCTPGGQHQTCVMQSSGCTDWSFPAACMGNQTCASPSTTCAVQPCTAGQTRCTNNVASVCNASGAWVDTTCQGAQVCQSGQCVDPTCATGCTTPPGATCLNANTAVTYASTGTCVNAQCAYAQTQTACPFGCVSGACATSTTCTPNSRRCNGPQIQVCNGSGSAWLFAQTCTGTCSNGLCDAPCTPSAVRCNGDTVETCNAGGTAWAAGTTCTQGCLSGACLTDELVVNGNTVQLDGEHHYATRVWVKNGGQLQVAPGHKLTLYAPTITVDVSSSISGMANGATCTAAPDDVAQGIRLIANQVTVNGSVTWSGTGCAKDGIVIRADTIDGPGTVTSSARSLLLYGAGGVAPGLMAMGATKSLMPPSTITSSNYPEGGVYNDDGPPPLFSWNKPASTVSGYYWTQGATSAVPTPQSTFAGAEVLALQRTPPVGTLYLDVVSLDNMGVVGTVPHEFVIRTQGLPPLLTSTTNPTPGTWSQNPTVIVAWDGGNPGVGYYHLFDPYPGTRPTMLNGVFEPTNKSPPQVLMQNVTAGRHWFHMLALDSMGYGTRSAAHYEVDIGAAPDAGTIAGTVKDSNDAGLVGATVVVQRGLYTATTVAGGVYTFGQAVLAGDYEVVAKLPDAGLQAAATMLTVSPGQTTEADFVLKPGSGCPTCTDLCSGVACTSPGRCTSLIAGTCNAGVCAGGDPTGFGVIPLQVSVPYYGNTTGAPNSFVPANHASSSSGSDLVFSFTAPASRTYTFTGDDNGRSWDSIIYLVSALPAVCGGAVTVSTVGYADDPPVISGFSMVAGQTVYVVFDAFSSGSGPMSLTVQ